MFLAFRHDFQKEVYIKTMVAPYGYLISWYTDANKSRILVQDLLLSSDHVPRSLVVSTGTTLFLGVLCPSWSISVYIHNDNILDAFPTDKDPIPFDGEPQPEHDPIVIGPDP